MGEAVILQPCWLLPGKQRNTTAWWLARLMGAPGLQVAFAGCSSRSLSLKDTNPIGPGRPQGLARLQLEASSPSPARWGLGFHT